MRPRKPLVAVVDDDLSVRESLPDLLRELGFRARAFESAEAFLASGVIGEARCLILDVAMPGMSGPDLYRQLQAAGRALRVIFVTAAADQAVRRQMLAEGAVECLFKPFSEAQLIAALNAALPEQ
jgi:FixJ family two-component response regulator